MRYVIYLKNHAGEYVRGDVRQEGYVSAHALAWGRLGICRDLDGAAIYETYEAAEASIRELVAKFGLDEEEANIRPAVLPSTYDLTLGGTEDGISVVEESGKRYILVRNQGFEVSQDVPEELADLLVPVLIKIEELLDGTTPDGKHGSRNEG